MEAKELRIGNWVNLYLNHEDKIEISLDSQDLSQLFRDDDFHLLEPIPLTEEWLIKFGAKHKTESFYQINNWEIDLITGFIDNGICIINEKAPIKFVHSFQNLYFCHNQKDIELCK